MHLSRKKPGTRAAYICALNHLERIVDPKSLSSVTSNVISMMASRLHIEGLRPASVACYLRHLRGALRWAHRQGYLKKAPRVEGCQSVVTMRGRPITREEFERMLSVIAKVRPRDHARWPHLLNGIWFTGLRLSESVRISWDETEDICILTSGRHWKIRFFAGSTKGGRHELVPLCPDAVEYLRDRTREGPVFPVQCLTRGEVSRVNFVRARALPAPYSARSSSTRQTNENPLWVRRS